MRAERPDVNGATALWIFLWERFVVNDHPDAGGVGLEVFLNDGEMSKSAGHEEIGLAAPLDEEARDGLAIADHVLGGSGFVIDVARVDVGAVIEQAGGDFDGRGEMEWRLAIASPGMNRIRIGEEESFDVVEHAEACGSVDAEDGPTFKCVSRDLWRGTVENSETPGPPAAARIDVRTGLKQHIEHLAAAHAHNGGGIKWANRLVDERPEAWVCAQQFAHCRRIIAVKGFFDLIERGFHEVMRLCAFQRKSPAWKRKKGARGAKAEINLLGYLRQLRRTKALRGQKKGSPKGASRYESLFLPLAVVLIGHSLQIITEI